MRCSMLFPVRTPTSPSRSETKARNRFGNENQNLHLQNPLGPAENRIDNRVSRMRFRSNDVLGPANIGVALVSVAVLGASVWLTTKHDQDCVTLLQTPVMVAALLLFCIAVLGLVASSRRNKLLLLIYAVLLVLGSLLMAALAIFAVAVAGPAPAEEGVMQYGKIREYGTTRGFSPWLQERVQERQIRECFDSGLCKAMDARYKSLMALYFSGTVKETEAGCCKPPTGCGFSFENATAWAAVTAAAMRRQRGVHDCAVWSNDPERLCFGCEACRAVLLAKVRHDWLVVGGVSMAAVALLLGLALLTGGALLNLRARAVPDSPPAHKQSPFL